MCFGGLVNNCAHGVRTQICVVDTVNLGFQCVSDDHKTGFYLPFDKGTDLLCASPAQTESFLKACKEHHPIDITLCSYRDASFLCTNSTGERIIIPPHEADNYFCLTPRDRARVLERCK